MSPFRFLHSAVRALFRRASQASRRPPTVYDEMRCGALVGCVSAVSLCVACSLPLAGAVGATLGGLCAGSVIGLVLWSGSPSLPEDLVVPPTKGQERCTGPSHSLAQRLHRVLSR